MIDEYPEQASDPSWGFYSAEDLGAFIDADEVLSQDGSLSEIMVVDGWRIALKVRDGCLLLEDGVKPSHRTRTITPIDAAKIVRSVIVLGAGFITTEAFTWCFEHGVELAILRTGNRPTALTPGLIYGGSLRRAQARAQGTKAGIAIFRELVSARIADMADIAGRLSEDYAARIKARVAVLDSLRSVHDIQVAAESQAAKLYWLAWREVTLRFDWRAPEYYKHFESRRSHIGWTENSVTSGKKVRATSKAIAERRSNRHAMTPTNAMLNFGYKVGESEAVRAMIGAGLDPGMGLAHVDTKDQERMSGALDILEVGRGVVERHVLDLIQGAGATSPRRFTRADFRRLPQGELRLGPPLSHEMAKAVVPELRAKLVEQAMWVAKTLGRFKS